MVRKNLSNSFPDKSDHERKVIEREFYRNLADYSVEVLKLLTIQPDELKRRIVFKNAELIQKYKEEGKSIIGLASHQFNWEWVLAGGSLVLPIDIDFVYQPVSSPLFEEFSYACRTRFGAYAIKRTDVAREAIRRREKQRLISIVADQYPGYEHDKKYITKFLNQETAFFDGTNQMAILTQFPVTYFSVKKVRRGFYEVFIEEVALPPYGREDKQAVENYVRALEKQIELQPANWLWSHNRWKTRHLQENESAVVSS